MFHGILVLFLAGSLAHSFTNKEAQTLGFEILDQKAPPLEFADSKGHLESLKTQKGKAVFLHLWATWCEPCKKEIPQLIESTEKMKDKNLSVIFVSVNKEVDRSQVEDFLHGLKFKITPYIVKESPDAQKYYAWGIPMTYLIDSKGNIVARAMGAKGWSLLPQDKMKKFISSLE